jgi:hypothetical protein
MKGWLRITPDVLGEAKTLAAWTARGVAYARTLPAK